MNNACTIPLDVVATNNQITASSGSIVSPEHASKIKAKNGLIATAKAIYAEGGIKAFWAGLAPSCLLVINPAINFMALDQLKVMYKGQIQRKKLDERSSRVRATAAALSPLEAFFIGAAAKSLATSVTFPLIRAKVLSMSRGRHDSGGNRRVIGMRNEGEINNTFATLDVISEVIRNEGIVGLYKGLGVQLSRSALAAAIMCTTREQLDKLTAGTLRRLKDAAVGAARR